MAKMLCPDCKERVSERDEECPHCGCLFEDENGRREDDIGEDAGVRLLLPVGRSGWAIAAGYLGLISVLCVPSPLALITGILAVREISRNPKKHGLGRAWFGIIMGGFGTLFIIIILAMGAFQGFR